MSNPCTCCTPSTCTIALQVQTRFSETASLNPFFNSADEKYYEKWETGPLDQVTGGTPGPLLYSDEVAKRLYTGIEATYRLRCQDMKEEPHSYFYHGSDTQRHDMSGKCSGEWIPPFPIESLACNGITPPGPPEDYQCVCRQVSARRLEAQSIAYFQECVEGKSWQNSSNRFSGIAEPVSTYVQDMRFRFRLVKGCHQGCLKMTRLDDIAPIKRISGSEGAELEAIDIITNGRGTSTDYSTTKNFGSVFIYQVETDNKGLIIDHSASGTALGVAPLIGKVPLANNHNQYAEYLFETTVLKGVTIINTMVPEGCPNEERFTDWIHLPLPVSTDPVRHFVRFLQDQTFFEKCEDAVDLPCSGSESLMSSMKMMAIPMAMAPAATTPVGTAPTVMEIEGPPLWADLHATAKAGELTPEWLADFALRIPCGICRAHWLQMIAEHLPRYDDQYQWSVERHNEVNVRLGKAVWVPKE